MSEIPKIIRNAIQNIKPNDSYEDGREYFLKDIATEMVEQAGYSLDNFIIDQVFDSPGCDIYVLSFTILDDKGNQINSWHNIYERI